MKRTRFTVIGAVAVLAMLAAGCGHSNSSSSGGGSNKGSGGGGGGKTITIGVLADLTGAGSNTAGTFPEGVQAGIGVAKAEGYNFKMVEADSTTSPSGILAGAQKLVEQDHVTAVLLTSVVGFGAAPWLASHNVPVIGCACDGTEWITDKNMFSVIGTQDYNKVQTTEGLFLKDHGVTVLGTAGYSVEPSSADTAKDTALSAEHYGIKVGYINANFPLGSTNVAPIALAMKNAHVDGIATAILTASTFAIIEDLKADGVQLKAALPPTGYGGDLIEGGKGAEEAAQGVYFLSGWEPVEMHTPATEAFQAAMTKYAGVKGDPTFAEYIGYTSVAALVDGLKKAGPHPTNTSLINAMLGITDFNAAGLYGTHSIGWALNQRGVYSGAQDCQWITQFKGTTFHLVPGEDPLCGTNLPGETIADAP